MSLAKLVAFAQQFLPASDDLVDSEPVGTNRQRPRVPPPEWLQRSGSHNRILDYGQHRWTVDGARPPEPATGIPPGPDSLAFYMPYHFHATDWGVFIRLSGVRNLATFLRGASLTPGDEAYLYLAERVLREHELYHAATEIACTRAELLARRPIYQDYFESESATHLEEALANAYLLRRLFGDRQDPLGVRPRLELWMAAQGPGYQDFPRWLSARTFARGQEAAVRFLTESLSAPAPRSGSLHAFLFRGAASYRSMRIVHVNDLGPSAASLWRPFPKAFGMQVFAYVDDHSPRHVHIEAGGKRTRYLWPELTPYPGDHRLPSAIEKKLRKQYVPAHRHLIEARFAQIGG